MNKIDIEKISEGNHKAYSELIETLEKVKDAIKKQNYGIAMDILCKPYPAFQVITLSSELKESEDERIRKDMIETIKKESKDFPSSVIAEKSHTWLAYLEKQGEQIRANSAKTCKDGQESADKVDPKYHKGDWVICKNGSHRVFQVIEHSWPNAKYLDGKGAGGFLNVFTLDKQYRPWTIQDAKDGDVIYSRHNIKGFEWIGIFKSLDKENKRVFFYGFWHDMAKTFSVCRNEAYILYDDFSPATKEQRDLLFQKMNEAGYEWDAEKKELKKIDDEEFNGEDYEIDSLYHAQRILEKTLGKVEGYQTDDGILSHQCAISAVKKLYGQKPWSEEDENMIKRIKEYLNIAIGDLSNKLNGRIVTIGNSEYSSMMIEISKCISWLEVRLKSLKDIYTWKPSVEQMDALSFYLKNDVDNDGVFGRQLVKLYQDLKKLMEE